MGNRSGNNELDIYRTCCFTGLRPQKLTFGFDEGDRLCLQIKERLKQEIIRLITEQHVTHFISGMALGVDQWAARPFCLCGSSIRISRWSAHSPVKHRRPSGR